MLSISILFIYFYIFEVRVHVFILFICNYLPFQMSSVNIRISSRVIVPTSKLYILGKTS